LRWADQLSPTVRRSPRWHAMAGDLARDAGQTARAESEYREAVEAMEALPPARQATSAMTTLRAHVADQLSTLRQNVGSPGAVMVASSGSNSYDTDPDEEARTMTAQTLQAVLGWAALLNFGLLLFWFGMLMVAHDWVYGIHSKWFKVSVEEFDAAHYKLLGFYELSIFVVLLGPYLAMRIVGAP